MGLKISFIVLFLLMTLLPAAGISSTQNEKSLSLYQSYSQLQKEIQENENKRRQTLSALYELNKKMKKLVFDRGRLKVEIMILDQSIAKLTDSMDTLKIDIKSQKQYLAMRLRSLYHTKSSALFQYLFTSRDSSSIDRKLHVLRTLARRDKEVIQNLISSLERFNKSKERLGEQKLALFKKRKESESQETAYQAEQNLKNRLLAGVQRSQIFQKTELDRLRQRTINSLHDDTLIDIIYQPSFALQKGQLLQPVTGTIETSFGILTIQGLQFPHRGLQYRSTKPMTVHAVFSGKIREIAELPSYGRVLIIDHGDHYYTLYGSMSEVRVKMNDFVSTGQVIGISKTSDLFDSSGLYFELRHFSEPEDPEPWFKINSHLASTNEERNSQQ